MGCDIDLCVEARIDPQPIVEWQTVARFYLPRNYLLFALLAGVRNSFGVTPVSKPRGLPGDCTYIAQCARQEDFGHSESWLWAGELQQVWGKYCLWLEESNIKFPESKEVPDLEWSALLALVKALQESVSGVRVVFWFDG